jgi:hypothetical protein
LPITLFELITPQPSFHLLIAERDALKIMNYPAAGLRGILLINNKALQNAAAISFLEFTLKWDVPLSHNLALDRSDISIPHHEGAASFHRH